MRRGRRASREAAVSVLFRDGGGRPNTLVLWRRAIEAHQIVPIMHMRPKASKQYYVSTAVDGAGWGMTANLAAKVNRDRLPARRRRGCG
jgi:hypothetical protein